MRPEIFPCLGLLFLACGVPSNAQNEGEATTTASAAAAGERAAAAAVAVASVAGEIEVLYDVGRIFSLNCTPPQVDKDGISYVWKKNGTALESVWELTGRHKLDENNGVFRMTERALESDFGNYTCEPAGAATVTFHVRGRPYAKLASDTNVVEDTKLKIVCKVVGKPYPGVTWTFSNDSASTGSDVQAALGARVTLATSEQGVEQAELVVEAAQRADAGVYTCVPRDAAGVPASTTLRVKDKYAALWPFLGICAEVFVLCAIILVYEKRRTKPELDDSDTDNHDQKKS